MSAEQANQRGNPCALCGHNHGAGPCVSDCPGHPDDGTFNGPAGETFYCDGSCVRKLRERADRSDPPGGEPVSERARVVGQTLRSVAAEIEAESNAAAAGVADRQAAGINTGPGVTEITTIAGARLMLSTLRKQGTVCPCCDQRVQEYRRKLTASMVRTLGAMLREARRRGGDLEFVDLPEIPQRSRDVTAAQYWGLIVRADDQRPGEVGSGRWRLTKLGVDWLSGWSYVPKYAHVYNGRLVDRSGPPVSVYDVEPKFNLRELLEGV